LGAGPLGERVNSFCVESGIVGVRADCLHSAALLWHDHLEASHRISQGIDTVEGSFLHGIMHRREPDYGNAAYWFRRVGEHPAFSLIAAEAGRRLGKGEQAGVVAEVVHSGGWDPFRFIDACEAVSRGGAAVREAALRELQAIEFEVLVCWVLRDRPVAHPPVAGGR